MKNTFTCLLIIVAVFSGIYSCNKPASEQSPAAEQETFSAIHGSTTINPGELHNKVLWVYMNAKPQGQTEFSKAEVLQMTKDVLSIMVDEGYYEDYILQPDVMAEEMIGGMEAMGYFNAAGQLKSSEELKTLKLYTDNNQPLQKILNKINTFTVNTAPEFIDAAKTEMSALQNTSYQTEALAFNSIIDSSADFVPKFINFSLPSIILPSASNLRIAYADAKGYTEGTKAAQDQGKNVVQQDIWGLTYSSTRSIQQFKRELGI